MCPALKSMKTNEFFVCLFSQEQKKNTVKDSSLLESPFCSASKALKKEIVCDIKLEGTKEKTRRKESCLNVSLMDTFAEDSVEESVTRTNAKGFAKSEEDYSEVRRGKGKKKTSL